MRGAIILGIARVEATTDGIQRARVRVALNGRLVTVVGHAPARQARSTRARAVAAAGALQPGAAASLGGRGTSKFSCLLRKLFLAWRRLLAKSSQPLSLTHIYTIIWPLAGHPRAHDTNMQNLHLTHGTGHRDRRDTRHTAVTPIERNQHCGCSTLHSSSAATFADDQAGVH